MKSSPVEVGNGEYNARIDLNVFSKDVFVFAAELGTILIMSTSISFLSLSMRSCLRFSE